MEPLLDIRQFLDSGIPLSFFKEIEIEHPSLGMIPRLKEWYRHCGNLRAFFLLLFSSTVPPKDCIYLLLKRIWVILVKCVEHKLSPRSCLLLSSEEKRIKEMGPKRKWVSLTKFWCTRNKTYRPSGAFHLLPSFGSYNNFFHHLVLYPPSKSCWDSSQQSSPSPSGLLWREHQHHLRRKKNEGRKKWKIGQAGFFNVLQN